MRPPSRAASTILRGTWEPHNGLCEPVANKRRITHYTVRKTPPVPPWQKGRGLCRRRSRRSCSIAFEPRFVCVITVRGQRRCRTDRLRRPRETGWQRFFPASRRWRDRNGKEERSHLHLTAAQRAVSDAAKRGSWATATFDRHYPHARPAPRRPRRSHPPRHESHNIDTTTSTFGAIHSRNRGKARSRIEVGRTKTRRLTRAVPYQATDTARREGVRKICVAADRRHRQTLRC
jgi:hypothetical protein